MEVEYSLKHTVLRGHHRVKTVAVGLHIYMSIRLVLSRNDDDMERAIIRQGFPRSSH